jgi:flagellar biosynthesis/type III secretory pathway protein FliH
MKAQLIGAPLRSDLTLEVLQNIQQAHRMRLVKQQQASRKKMLRYARWARARGFSKGYIEGASKHSEDVLQAIAGIKRCYHEALEVASQDTQVVARKLVTRVIEDISVNDSQHLEKWISHALLFLKKNRPLTLYYNPRYQDVIQNVRSNLPSSITVQVAPDLDHTDFYLEEDNGGIEFSWREIIEDPSCALDLTNNKDSHVR